MYKQIWMEGFIATGQVGRAHLIWSGEAKDFDDAIRQYSEKPYKEDSISYKPQLYKRSDFISDKAYEKRRSNWKIWGCALFDNEADARKSFG